MVDEYLDLIKSSSASVASEDIVDCIKVAFMLGYLGAAALGTGAGILGKKLYDGNQAAQKQTDAQAAALLAGLAGTGLGYHLSSRKSSPSVQQYEYQSEPGELTVQDIYG